MKFVSFNINGIRAHLHQLEVIITTLQPDIIGLQETKVHNDIFPYQVINNYSYHVYYHGQKGKYGVALLSKNKPIAVHYDLEKNSNNTNCRVIIANFVIPQGILTVVNVYCPQGNNRNHLVKFLDKQYFYQKIQKYVEYSQHVRSLLLIMGDMNITPTNIDIGLSEKNRNFWLKKGKCSFLPEEINWINQLFECGLVDTYRQCHPNKNNQYSWFDYRYSSFNKNIGLRIDLILVSQQLSRYIQDTGIYYDIRAMQKTSDHAPIWTNFRF